MMIVMMVMMIVRITDNYKIYTLIVDLHGYIDIHWSRFIRFASVFLLCTRRRTQRRTHRRTSGRTRGRTRYMTATRVHLIDVHLIQLISRID